MGQDSQMPIAPMPQMTDRIKDRIKYRKRTNKRQAPGWIIPLRGLFLCKMYKTNGT